jgi:hypothetical protein
LDLVLLEDALRRSATREADRAERAAKSAADLQRWAAAFYTESETASTAAALEPIVTLTGGAGAQAMAMRLARDLREDH